MRNRKAKPIKVWMAKRPGESLCFSAIGHTRAYSKERLLKHMGPTHGDWKKLYRNGWRIVRVTVREGWPR